ncbi:MAG: hypothetical protein ACRDQA_15740 [Nocardioidaceae bacterium]
MPDQSSDGSIIISPREFYDGVREDISEIKNNLETVKDNFSDLPRRVDAVEKRVDILDERQDKSERRLAWMFGVGAALAFLGSLLGTALPGITG